MTADETKKLFAEFLVEEDLVEKFEEFIESQGYYMSDLNLRSWMLDDYYYQRNKKRQDIMYA